MSATQEYIVKPLIWIMSDYLNPVIITTVRTKASSASVFIHLQSNYSRLSLSRLRLSRITAYLEEKVLSLFQHRNLTSGNKILWIREGIAPQKQFLAGVLCVMTVLRFSPYLDE